MSDFSPPSAVELRHLRYFIAVAAHGSFNRAAEVLHLTQPALSRQVKDLEEEIGAPLVVRGTNYVTMCGHAPTKRSNARAASAAMNRSGSATCRRRQPA
jgi:LysR family hca operon transcriptional activator